MINLFANEENSYIDVLGRNFLPELEKPSDTDGKKILFLGNSITLSKPEPNIGWFGNFGMAASAKGNDYAHKLTEILGWKDTDAFIMNLYPLEIDSTILDSMLFHIDKAVTKKTQYVIIQMGDNVPHGGSIDEFQSSVQGILETISKHPIEKIVCVSSYWSIKNADEELKRNCEEFNGLFVYIGDIYRGQNSDYQKFENHGVNMHPKDDQMKEISYRIFHSLFSQKSRIFNMFLYRYYLISDSIKIYLLSKINKLKASL